MKTRRIIGDNGLRKNIGKIVEGVVKKNSSISSEPFSHHLLEDEKGFYSKGSIIYFEVYFEKGQTEITIPYLSGERTYRYE